jgi:predicted aminopeptidase
VEQEGLRRWLERHGSERDIEIYALAEQRRHDFGQFIETYRDRLDALYESGVSQDDMRRGKHRLFAEMRADYEKLKVSWGGFAGFDRFFALGANNALLASIAIYSKRVPAFQALLAESGGDLPRFYAAARRLARMGKAERTAALDQLAPATAEALKPPQVHARKQRQGQRERHAH